MNKREIAEYRKYLASKKPKKESLRDRLQHDENAWLESEIAFNKQFAQLFGYILRFEKRTIKRLERLEKRLTTKIKKEKNNASRNVRNTGTDGKRRTRKRRRK